VPNVAGMVLVAVGGMQADMTGKIKLARKIAARSKPRFIEIPRERKSKVHYTEEQLRELRGGITVEEYRAYLIRKWGSK
jgi:hypothetical protein